jgi:hypothetical protein
MKFSKFAKFAVILSIIPALYVSVYPGKIVLITVLCAYPLLIGILFKMGELYKSNEKINKNFDKIFYVKLFIIYNLTVLFRGLYDAKSDQDWIVMISSTIPLYLIIHFTIYFAAYRGPVISLIRTFWTYGLVLCLLIFLFFPAMSGDFVKSISPVYILILMIPYVNKKVSICIISLVIISFTSDFTNRSNLINILIAFMIISTFVYRKWKWMLNLVKSFRVILLLAPVTFLIMGLSGVFNIFLIGDSMSNYSIASDSGNKQDLLIDSRTSIYVDVFSQLKEDDAFVFGLGASGKTKTSLTDIQYSDFDVIYKEGRRGTESGMLNYIQWGGLLGGLIYFLLFVNASYLGIYKSNNWFCVMLGLWVAFKGLFSFIEDPNIFAVNSIFVFLSIGICFSKKLRCLDDAELKSMFNKTLKWF